MITLVGRHTSIVAEHTPQSKEVVGSMEPHQAFLVNLSYLRGADLKVDLLLNAKSTSEHKSGSHNQSQSLKTKPGRQAAESCKVIEFW